MRTATGLASRTARWSRAPGVRSGRAQQVGAHQLVGVLVEGGDVERGHVALVARAAGEPAGVTTALGRPLPHHQRAGRHVAQPLVPGGQQDGHHRDEPHRAPGRSRPAPPPPARRPAGTGSDVPSAAHHPQAQRRLARGAAPPQRLEGAEPGHHHADPGPPRAAAPPTASMPSTAPPPGRRPATNAAQRQHVDGEGQRARGDPGPLEVEQHRLGGDDPCVPGVPDVMVTAGKPTRQRVASWTGHRPLHRPQRGRLGPPRRPQPARGRGVRKLSLAEVDELVDLYQRVSSHLSHARVAYDDPA